MVQLDGQKSEQGDLIFTLKIDAANLEQKHNLHGGVWGGSRLSFGFRIGGTSDLESLGSNGSMYMAHPL